MRSFSLLFAIAILSGNAAAQGLSYSVLPTGPSAPPPRSDGTIAYDPSGRQLLLFGGLDGSSRSDLWAYSLEQNQWRELQPSGSKPPARFGHTLVFDPVRRRLVLFGGQSGGFFNDTWAYDVAGNAWSRLNPTGQLPNERYGHSAIYEAARDRMVISHGFTDEGRFDDTWAFDFATNTWRNISPPSNRPLRRCLHHAVYDPTGGQMLLFGGCSSGFGPCPLGDLWAFDLTTNQWSEKTSQPTPSPRQHYGLAYDTVRDRMVVFGGAGRGTLDDTWDYNPRTNSWSQLTISNSPAPRSRVEAAFASDRGTAYFFGGATSTGQTNELWALSSGGTSTLPRISDGGVVNVFSGSTGPVAPGEIVSVFGDNLGPAEGVALGYDLQTNRLPTSAAGVSVTWNGINAPLYFVRRDQVNVQVPYELSGAVEARLSVRFNGQKSLEKSVALTAVQPGIYPAVWNQDGTINSAANPADVGSIVTLFGTGQGVTAPVSVTGAPAQSPYPEPVASVQLQIGSIPAQVLFRGQAPLTTGVMQINARVPASPPGSQAIVLTIGSAASQPGVKIYIR